MVIKVLKKLKTSEYGNSRLYKKGEMLIVNIEKSKSLEYGFAVGDYDYIPIEKALIIN